MIQTTFLDNPPLPPHNSTPTSVAAAEAIKPRAGTKRAAVLDDIRGQGIVGATREEISLRLNIKIQTVCGRVHELVKMSLIIGNGKTRQTLAKVQAEVLTAT